ncbi:MAG: winged helix DNA-binding protein [Candidatus Odinarchaeota archaeon]
MTVENAKDHLFFEEINEDYPNITVTEIIILYQLDSEMPKKIEEISKETSLSVRSLRYSMKKLIEKELVITYPDFMDLRSKFYKLKANNHRLS